MRWSSMNGLFSGGRATVHIMTSISAPDAAAMRMPIPRMSARPIPARPTMKSQSAHVAPAMLWYIPGNGPVAAWARKPLVGLPPLSHAPSLGVAKPRPKSLSTKAQRKIQPRLSRRAAATYRKALPAFVSGAMISGGTKLGYGKRAPVPILCLVLMAIHSVAVPFGHFQGLSVGYWWSGDYGTRDRDQRPATDPPPRHTGRSSLCSSTARAHTRASGGTDRRHLACWEAVMDETLASMEHLSVSESWSLVRSAPVGRLAVVVDGRPEIFPLNHVVDHGTLVFRTAE